MINHECISLRGKLMKEKQKVYVLGIDGVTFRIIEPMVNEGSLPNFERVMKRGIYGTLDSTIPPLSGPAWTSFMTGMTPSNHGIFDFVLKKSNSYKTYYANFQHIKGKTVWNILGDYGKKVIIQNIMVTYPPTPVRGYLITGGLTPSGNNYTYPKSLATEIESKFGRYPHLPVGGINVSSSGERKYIETFYKNMEKRAEITKYLMKKPWDLFVVMFEGTDPLQHEFWKYIDDQHPHYKFIEDDFIRNAIQGFYKKIDEFLGEVLNELDEHTTLFIMSDHGFGRLEKYIQVNNFLIDVGMLKLKRDIRTRMKKLLCNKIINLKNLYSLSQKLGLTSVRSKFRGGKPEKILSKFFLASGDIDWERTKAFSVGTGGHIYVNLQGREPKGIVKSGEEYESVVDEIVQALKNLKDPKTGKKVVKNVYIKKEIYNGKLSDIAPDVSFIPVEGYSTLQMDQFVSPLIFIDALNSGTHKRDGIFMAYGPEIARSRLKADIIDIAPTILHLFGSQIPKEMDGRVLKEIFKDDSEFAKKEIIYQTDYERKHIKEKIANLRKLGKI